MLYTVNIFLLFLYFISTTGWFYVCCIRDVFILVFIANLYFILQTTLLLCRTESQIWGFHTMTRLHSYLLFAEVVEIIFLYEAMILFMCWFVVSHLMCNIKYCLTPHGTCRYSQFLYVFHDNVIHVYSIKCLSVLILIFPTPSQQWRGPL